MKKIKTIVLLIISILLVGCNDVENKQLETPSKHSDSFIELAKNNNKDSIDENEYIGENIENFDEFMELIDDTETDTGEVDYYNYTYEISDMQSDNINTDEINELDFVYDLSEIQEEEIRNLIKSIYVEENASELIIVDYYKEDNMYSGEEEQSQVITCVIKVDEYHHIITYENGRASSIKDVNHLYEL